MTDAELLRAVKTRDAAAWRELYLRYLPAVWRYAFALVGDQHVAEDIVSDTMMALVQAAGRLDPEVCQMNAWLRTVVRNKAADYRRRNARVRSLKRTLGLGSNDSGSVLDPTKPLELAETRSQVLTVMDKLPEEQRLALEMKYLDQLSVRDIADRTGQTEKSVESTLYRARCEFRRLFAQLEHAQPRPYSAASDEPISESGKNQL